MFPLSEALPVEVSPCVNGNHRVSVELERHDEWQHVGIAMGKAVRNGSRRPEHADVWTTEVSRSCGDCGANETSLWLYQRADELQTEIAKDELEEQRRALNVEAVQL